MRQFTLALGMLLLMTSLADAQKSTYVPKMADKAKVRDVGWDASLTLGASAALANSTSVVGQVDGTTFSLGAQLVAGLDYIKGEHEWRNVLKLSETVSRTPVVDEFIKTVDLLDVSSIYLYHIKPLPWLGPFARLRLKTQLFPSYDVRPQTVIYSIAGGTLTANELQLAKSFKPLSLRETAGLFAKAVSRKTFNVEFKLGFQASQTFAENQLAIDDDDATPEIEVKVLEDVIQGGPSVGVLLRGKITEKRISYYFDAETMLPVINNKDETDDRNAVDLLNVEIEAGLSVKVFDWMSVDYTFRALREPQLLDKFQVQNNILFTFS
ncbi:MAG: hypothetical protein JRH20_16930, partial [Deltaproteobacteria bacterium]|nr:hypothetical protein [Deltaproteobacteria bacterium]